ncbi:dephospho-CoA kinase [Urechidicola croceus]|uniref:Dephospho-CoA kinase n=2 Tax=Urechidicola croceus TaxID=1850246 RepID=A0A1D8P4A8_9FLAO|nr:dephospho-CoA kinase [Urechidicola croceus]
MMVVGLTGGIGSGKTTVLKMFQKYGIDCYIADVEAKKLMNSSNEIKKEVIDVFGNQAYIDNQLNRKYIAQIVFQNPDKLDLLNSIVHPKVRKHFRKFVENSTSAYVIYESAILFENNGEKQCDFIITVSAPKNVRIQRVIARDNVSEIEVLHRIKNQLSDEEKISKSDFVIENIDLELTKLQVRIIHQELLKAIDTLKE